MAPYRPSGGRESRRSGRSYVDHDILEGLPIRQWRRQSTTIGAPKKIEHSSIRSPQLELPMPKDAHLLSPMSQALLQAARAGTVHKPPPVEEEEEQEEVKDVGEEEEEKVVDRGFVAKRWAPVPRHLEGPEPEYLAKKRKGLVSTTPRNVVQIGPEDMRKAKVRRIDSDGNSYITEVIAAQGQKVEGDIIEETPLTDGAAPGTVVEGLGVVNAEGVVVVDGSAQAVPQRKRPPPPRRKPRGPGKGRKQKKLQFALDPTMGPTGGDGTASNAADLEGGTSDPHDLGDEGVNDANDEDMEMADGNEDDEDEEEGEEDDDAEEDDENRDDGDLPIHDEADGTMTTNEPSLEGLVEMTSLQTDSPMEELRQPQDMSSLEHPLTSLDAQGEEDSTLIVDQVAVALSNPILPDLRQNVDETPMPHLVKEASIPEDHDLTKHLPEPASRSTEQPSLITPYVEGALLEEPIAAPMVDSSSSVQEAPSAEAFNALASLQPCEQQAPPAKISTENVETAAAPHFLTESSTIEDKEVEPASIQAGAHSLPLAATYETSATGKESLQITKSENPAPETAVKEHVEDDIPKTDIPKAESSTSTVPAVSAPTVRKFEPDSKDPTVKIEEQTS